MDIKIKRREILIFFTSAIFLGIETGLISNAIFTEFYKDNEKKFIIINLIAFIILAYLLIYKLMLYMDKKVVKSKLLFTFDYKHKKFIDIPKCPSSVNARVFYDKIDDKDLKQNIPEFNMSKFENTNLYKFVESMGPYIIITHFMNHRSINYKKRITISDLPTEIVEFKYLDTNRMLGGEKYDNGLQSKKLTLPQGFKITSIERNKIKLKSLYGYIIFTWRYSFGLSQISKELSVFSNIDTEQCIDIEMVVKLEYGCNLAKIFRKNINEFITFVDGCSDRMKHFDIENCYERFARYLPIKMMEYFENKFEFQLSEKQEKLKKQNEVAVTRNKKNSKQKGKT